MALCRLEKSRPASRAHLCPLQSRTASLCVICEFAVGLVSRRLPVQNLLATNFHRRDASQKWDQVGRGQLQPPTTPSYPPGKSGILKTGSCVSSQQTQRLAIISSILEHSLPDPRAAIPNASQAPSRRPLSKYGTLRLRPARHTPPPSSSLSKAYCGPHPVATCRMKTSTVCFLLLAVLGVSLAAAQGECMPVPVPVR